MTYALKNGLNIIRCSNLAVDDLFIREIRSQSNELFQNYYPPVVLASEIGSLLVKTVSTTLRNILSNQSNRVEPFTNNDKAELLSLIRKLHLLLLNCGATGVIIDDVFSGNEELISNGNTIKIGPVFERMGSKNGNIRDYVRPITLTVILNGQNREGLERLYNNLSYTL